LLDRWREFPMPLFYFNLQNTHTLADPDGTELPDVTAARAHAFGVARELMFKRRGMLERDWADWRMSVRDAGGKEVFSFTLPDVESGKNGR
jgi:Domain of unknown function (DUF6894)